MWIHRPLILAALAAVSCGFASAATCSVSDITAVGSLYTNNGCFNQDDNEQKINFTLSALTYGFTAYTWEWANPFGNGQGGFASSLALYDAGTGDLITYSDPTEANPQPNPSQATCGYAGNDPTQYGTCLDAGMFNLTLAAGNYFLVITEWGNDPTQLAYDPTSYSQYGTGNYTSDANHWAVTSDGCPFSGATTGCFLSPNDSTQRGNNWGITIAETPEPVTGLLGLSGLLLTWGVSRRRRTDRS